MGSKVLREWRSNYCVWALVSLLAVAVNCSGQNDQSPAPANSSCPTTTEALQAELLAPACGSNGCHGATLPALGLDLVSPGLEARLINVSASGCGEKVLVVPREASRSYLLEKVFEHEPSCGERMPIGSPMAPPAAACLQTWVNRLPETAASGGVAGFDSGGLGGASPSGGNSNAVGGSAGSAFNTGGRAQATGGSPAATGGSPAATGGTGGGGAGGEPVSAAGSRSTPGNCGRLVSFSNDVEPLLGDHCASAGCHSGMRPSEGLSLVAGKAYAALINQPSRSCAERLLVSPEDVSSSYLMDKLLDRNLCSGTRMPKSGTLPAQELSVIESWICHGAKND
jgi:hypothetical protein